MVEKVTLKRFIEPITFLILFAYAVADSVITDLIIFKSCNLMMGENSTICAILHENASSEEAKDLQNSIQPRIGTFLVMKSSIETFFPIFLILFLGPWSDKNGRKPLLIFPFLGSLIYYGSYAVFSLYDFNIFYYLIPSIISSIMGGFPSILMTSFSYLADVTSEKNRTWRLGLLDFIISGGQLVGFILNPIIFKNFGYSAVFSSSALSCFIGLLYSYFCLDETIRKDGDKRDSITSTFNPLGLLKELFKTVLKKRNNFDRCLIWSCLIIIAIHDDMMQGTATILYLYTKRFGWSIADFASYSVFQLLVTMCGMMFLIKIIAPVLRLCETSSIIIASLSNSSNFIIKAFAKNSRDLYISTGIGLFSSAPASLVRSIISKVVCQQDIGKAFAVTMIMEKVGPLLATPVFVYLHTNYLQNYPCPVWFLPAGLSLVIVALSITVRIRWNKLKKDNVRCDI